MKKNTAVPTAAIILAAGKGTRMKSDLPKVLHPVGGYPMVSHVVYHAQKAGLSPITVVVAPGMDAVMKAVRELDENAHHAIQHEQLGTAHAVLAARDALGDFDGNIMVLYGDTPLITSETIGKLNDALMEHAKCAVVVLGFHAEPNSEYGRLVMNGEALERIVEAKDASKDEKKITLCNSGVMALRGNVAWELLEAIDNDNAKGEYYLTDVVGLARKRGFSAAVVEGKAAEVLGVNSRAELAQAEAASQARARKFHMEHGVTLLDPESVYFSVDTTIGQDVVVEPHVFFGPGVAIGAGTRIKAFSHIEGTVIGEGASVGPFARLRPGTNIADEVKIGNFVEIKKAEVEAGAKISHLSYIGDASVGANANIGAGTITCNYDGYNKYRTEIGADVFIGSNSALVAPVSIGDGAMVAAGSVITEDIAPDALALARTRQEQKTQWAKSFREKNKK